MSSTACRRFARTRPRSSFAAAAEVPVQRQSGCFRCEVEDRRLNEPDLQAEDPHARLFDAQREVVAADRGIEQDEVRAPSTRLPIKCRKL